MVTTLKVAAPAGRAPRQVRGAPIVAGGPVGGGVAGGADLERSVLLAVAPFVRSERRNKGLGWRHMIK